MSPDVTIHSIDIEMWAEQPMLGLRYGKSIQYFFFRYGRIFNTISVDIVRASNAYSLGMGRTSNTCSLGIIEYPMLVFFF